MHGLIFETSICYWQDQPGISFEFASQSSDTFRDDGPECGGVSVCVCVCVCGVLFEGICLQSSATTTHRASHRFPLLFLRHHHHHHHRRRYTSHHRSSASFLFLFLSSSLHQRTHIFVRPFSGLEPELVGFIGRSTVFAIQFVCMPLASSTAASR